jgi:hypothetical protein
MRLQKAGGLPPRGKSRTAGPKSKKGLSKGRARRSRR